MVSTLTVAAVQAAFRVQPAFQRRVWGGRRLAACAGAIGEAWIVHETCAVIDGPFAGRSLGEAARFAGPALLGTRPVARTGDRFPLLLKLLDTVDWLSVQVHPDDAQAAALEGPGQWGKAEAWHIIEAEPGAQVIAGVRPGVSRAELAAAIRGGDILRLLQPTDVKAADTLMIPPGAIHALGPGLLLYEVQQASDITYRVFDWNRPATHGRALHIDQSAAVAHPDGCPRPFSLPDRAGAGGTRLLTSEHFALDLLRPERRPLRLTTHGETFHALTATRGTATVRGAEWEATLLPLETVIVPAATYDYTVHSRDHDCAVLLASVP